MGKQWKQWQTIFLGGGPQNHCRWWLQPGNSKTLSPWNKSYDQPRMKESEVTQSCPTLCNPMDCSLPRSSVHGIFQARVLEWVAISFSNDQPRQHIKKQRHYFANKVLVKAMVFPVIMYGCESWTLKKAECQKIDAFELWCWRRLLRVPWTASRSNQSIVWKSVLDIHWKEWCWSWNSNSWPPDAKNWLIGKNPDARKDWRWE